jgi:hypothetical protein
LATDRWPGLAVIEGESVPAVVSQNLGVTPAGGTDVECPPRGSKILQKPFKHSSPLAVPPVAAFECRKLFDLVFFHLMSLVVL